ncbi:OmpA family protein [Breoghania sp. L-A4]|uniref:OmpA family protein n=1 Tax=Breoghania sp. L-A4 TaxID=2304600 RepID=UPI000E35A4CA|nr:OmpA family protein [Breoghania sp. L-A4]AXS41577.1 hypothetical protein D1F64_18165 [Breoghania sp. L-A4]
MDSDAYNADLSERRALAVRDYLLSHFNIDEHRLIAIGFGETHLKSPSTPTRPRTGASRSSISASEALPRRPGAAQILVTRSDFS